LQTYIYKLKAFQLFKKNKKSSEKHPRAPTRDSKSQCTFVVLRWPESTLSLARVNNAHVYVIRLDDYTKSNPCALH